MSNCSKKFLSEQMLIYLEVKKFGVYMIIQESKIKFHTPINQNDISMVENLIYPIFSKRDEITIHYWKKIKSLFLTTMKLSNLGFLKRHILWFYINRTITNTLKKRLPLIEAEKILRNFIRKRRDKEMDVRAIELNRAKRSFDLIKKHLKGEKILDLGAGNGFIALEIKNKLEKDVILVDVVDYNCTNLPMLLYQQDDTVPLADEEADTTLLYTVLHHASNPEHVLEEATRVTKKRLVIMEGYCENDNVRVTNSFFDWFYNRVVGDEDINVPLNFLSVKGWEQILNLHGFEVLETKNLGFNEPLVPEHHILIIADRANS
ncbi:MAG: class I SAM-dependent methyltransferase [Candidatus Lokiarchaeota archaeon]|nr:class I SAM-dependent methyltransferase [Candidatus Lokiarchaeota archaeon]